ncbi:hypothetical protein GURASL_07630 [Geotalea uraniireducens]|uniref:YbaK/aminoacyl-tRNA synthetase-associated domain-containing protein n=1 Tax=Geotalea uraniireducens TaxID=351604 RepID=A0ABM8EHD3_9BACT|nr:YbaK/EbsC family protein [Geotalea uraniireducens]BDV41840.1 hypothetical protein GURASL_07630 [Geotalea uraniireducens]
MNEISCPAERLRAWMAANHVQGDHLSFAESCHSVAEAAAAAGISPEDLVKSICMIADNGMLLVAIVKGEDRASARRLGQAAGCPMPRLATPTEMLAATGYPCGGTPPFGFAARFFIDERVFDREIVYGGGGTATTLVRIAPRELQRLNGATVARIRK